MELQIKLVAGPRNQYTLRVAQRMVKQDAMGNIALFQCIE